MKRSIFSSIVLGLILFLSGCQSESPGSPSTNPSGATSEETVVTPLDTKEVIPVRGFYMGVLPTPADGQSFESSYNQAATFIDFVPVWGRPTPFFSLADELSGNWGQTFVDQYSRGNGMFPIINMSFIGEGLSLLSPPGIQGATLADTEWRKAYKQSALEIVRTAKPLYLSLGNEVNRWYEKYGANDEEPNGIQNYISLYNEIYNAVKDISPQTQVFCTFAREIVAEYREADMDVIRMFNAAKMDILVFTSYPHAVRGINQPADIPDDYYSRLLSYMPGKKWGFSEVAWPSLESFGGEQGQAAFLDELCSRLTRDRGINLYLLGWPWLHDIGDNDYTGLMKKDGTTKLAYDVWKSLSITGQYKTREEAIPAAMVKILPATDIYPPVLHSDEYELPIPMPYPLNTISAEDSGYIMPDGNTFYLWSTPDPNIPAEKQLFDGVTGLYVSHKVNNQWQIPRRIWVQGPGEVALDGCLFVQGNTMWFASARAGYTGLHWFTASFINGEWVDWKEAGFNPDYEVGELHISADGKELYFHSPHVGGQGQYDIWVSQKVNDQWQPPQNVTAVNSPETDGWPFLTPDSNELWFTRIFMGSPAIFRSRRIDGEWQEPEMIISQFAGEPSLDNEGNIYFTHHFYKDNIMLEADYYVAYKKK